MEHNNKNSIEQKEINKSTKSEKTMRELIILMMFLGIANCAVIVALFANSYWLKPIKYKTSDDVILEIERHIDKFSIHSNYSKEKAFNGYIKGFVDNIEDRYSDYISPKDAKRHLDNMNNISIGVGITYDIKTEDNKTLAIITDVIDNSPAKEAGIPIGGTIVKINNNNAISMSPQNLIESMRGEEGELLKLSISHNEYVKEYNLLRKKIIIKDVKFKILANDIGYIQIDEFRSATAADFSKAIEHMKTKNIKKFIFDVRNNPGGLLDSVVDIADQIVPEGLMVRIEEKQRNKEFISDKNQINGEIVVLVNGNTASAAEMFTLILKDFEKATVIGEKTFGKGTQLTTIKLRNGGLLTISTGLYYTKKSPNIEGIGITPDIEIKQTENKAYPDIQLDKAIEIMTK